VFPPEPVEKLEHGGGGRRRLAGAHVDNLDGVALLVEDLHVVVRLLALVEGGGVLVGRLGGLYPSSTESESRNFCTTVKPKLSLNQPKNFAQSPQNQALGGICTRFLAGCRVTISPQRRGPRGHQTRKRCGTCCRPCCKGACFLRPSRWGWHAPWHTQEGPRGPARKTVRKPGFGV